MFLCNDLPITAAGKERPKGWQGFGSWVRLASETGDECVEIVEAILDARAAHVEKLAYYRDDVGRVVLEIAAPLVRRALQERLLFCKRYRLDKRPVHASSTSVVYYAVDCEGCASADDGRPVALKFIHSRSHFEREMRARGALECTDSGMYVLGCLHSLDDDAFAKSVEEWNQAHSCDLGRFCIVMPRADRCVTDMVCACVTSILMYACVCRYVSTRVQTSVFMHRRLTKRAFQSQTCIV
jgi:hypothetical protein